MVAGSVAVQKGTPGWKCFQKGRGPSRRELYYVLSPRECKKRVAASFSFFQFSRVMLMSVYSFCNRKTKFELQN